jgi:hypothetical protein
MKTLQQFLEDAGILNQYRQIANKRKKETWKEKSRDPSLYKLSYMLTKELPPN